MGKHLFNLFFLWCILQTTSVFAQNSYPIFDAVGAHSSTLVNNAYLVTLNATEYKKLLKDRPQSFSLEIPYGAHEHFTVTLTQNDILADGFETTEKNAAGEQTLAYKPGLYYKGTIPNVSKMVAISFFDEEIIGVVATNQGDFVIGSYLPTETAAPSTHIIYNDQNLNIQNNWDCHTADLPPSPSTMGAPNGSGTTSANPVYGPVKFYFECDYDMYLDNSSSTTNTNNFVTGMFNAMSAYYQTANVIVQIQSTSVWSSNDPYPSSSSSAALDAFAQATQNNFNGDLAHLLSGTNAGNGGLAWVDVICANYSSSSFYGPFAYSNIHNSYNAFPTYSWTVEVVSHESGHNIASPHTHSCAWNGNGTQIDDCGNAYSPNNAGSCYNSGSPIIPAAGGTMMSYCHLNAVGISFNNGIHPQVAALMQSKIIGAVCVGSSPYCESQGNSTSDEWIETFVLDSINNVSGNNDGYANFRHLCTSLMQGSSTPISMSPAYSGTTYNEHFKVWIDFNQDNDFNDANEEVYYSGATQTLVSGTVTVPLTATLGNTRMRVAMKYNAAPDTCEAFSFGEVEDYTVTITAAGAILSATNAVTNATCNGSANGAINLTVTSGTPPYSFLWSNNATSEDLTNIAAGTYAVTVTDANSSTILNNIIVTQPSPIVPNATVSQPACSGNKGSATAAPTGGNSGYTYAWSGGNGNNATISNLSMGSYTVTVTDANNCAMTQTVTINAAPAAITSSASVTNVSCNGSTNGAINLSVSNAIGTPTYAWSNATTNKNPSGLSAGSYSVTITDANGCTHSNTFTVTQPAGITASLTVTQPTCSYATGSAAVNASGGAGNFSYAWSNSLGSGVAVNNLNSGTYTVTITDGNNCSTTKSTTISTPAAIAITGSATNVLCFGNANGAINISTTNAVGTPTYAWSNSSTNEDPSGLAAGSYTVTLTDANGCTASNTFTVGSPTAVTASVTATHPICSYELGTLTASGSGGTGSSTYLWSNNSATPSITGLSSGTYSVTVTDANGCFATNTGNVNPAPPAIVLSETITNVSCLGDANGAISISSANATAPFTPIWSNGMAVLSPANLTAGTYTLTFTDANGCLANGTYTITEPPLLTYAAAIAQHACNGNDGAITVNPAGGTTPYIITPTNLTGLTAGSYSVSVTDANGCPTASQNLDLETAPVAAFDTTRAERTVTFTNQSQFGASYLWDFGDGSTSTDFSPTHTYTTSGDFTVTLSTTNACGTATATVNIVAFLVGTKELVEDQGIRLFPNPTTDILSIDFDIKGEWTWQLYDLAGRLLMQNSQRIINPSNEQLSLAHLASGTYFMVFQSSDTGVKVTKKVIKQ